MPLTTLIVNLGAPFRIRAGTDIETAEYADGCVVTLIWHLGSRSSSVSRGSGWRTYRFAATAFAIYPAAPGGSGGFAGGAGYFDQGHLGQEFRGFTVLTPSRYVEVRRRLLREHPGYVLVGWPLPAG